MRDVNLGLRSRTRFSPGYIRTGLQPSQPDHHKVHAEKSSTSSFHRIQRSTSVLRHRRRLGQSACARDVQANSVNACLSREIERTPVRVAPRHVVRVLGPLRPWGANPSSARARPIGVKHRSNLIPPSSPGCDMDWLEANGASPRYGWAGFGGAPGPRTRMSRPCV